MSQHPKFKFLTPHTPQWRVLRREESQRRRIRDGDGNMRLAPGRVADPELDRCLYNVSTLLTEREYRAFMKDKPKHVTKSLWLRGMVCEFLESRRRKDLPTMPFAVVLPVAPEPDSAALPSAAKRRRLAA